MLFKTEILFEIKREKDSPEQFVTIYEGEIEEWEDYPFKEIIETFKEEQPNVSILKIKSSVFEFGHKEDSWKCP